MVKKIILLIAVLLAMFGIFYLGPFRNKSANIGGTVDNKIQIKVLKSPTCSCCAGYVDYLKREEVKVAVENVRDTLSVKEKYRIPSELESCHTSLAGDYFIEGHVPLEIVKKLLTEKPDILGIALPGMPSGAPGMSGAKTSFKIYQLSKDGQISEYATF